MVPKNFENKVEGHSEQNTRCATSSVFYHPPICPGVEFQSTRSALMICRRCGKPCLIDFVSFSDRSKMKSFLYRRASYPAQEPKNVVSAPPCPQRSVSCNGVQVQLGVPSRTKKTVSQGSGFDIPADIRCGIFRLKNKPFILGLYDFHKASITRNSDPNTTITSPVTKLFPYINYGPEAS